MKKTYLLFACFLSTTLFANEPDASNSFQFTKPQVEGYHKNSATQLEAIFAKLGSEFFVNAERILDIGCGDGKITAVLAKQMPQSSIVGCDVSHSMIAFAKKQYGSSEYPNLNFIEKNACKLGFKEEFDRVVSFNCLHWINDQKAALNAIFTCLKPGGKACLIASTRTVEDDLQFCCSKLVTSEKWNFYFQDYPKVHSFHTEEEYQQILTNSGFSIDNIQQNIREVVFENRQSFEEWVSPVLTPMHHLHEKNRKSFLNDLFAELKLRERVDESGKVHLHVSQIELLATRP